MPINKTFFKFFLGFAFIISMSFLIIIVVSYLGEGVQGIPEDQIIAN
ncbi:MAG: hypothetical protein PHX25_01765 [Candidatus Pacebacteria bacterium]|nr:hypothetical protein [Candidatus Paceibacterota bacterium]